jgi:hypothetical protein
MNAESSSLMLTNPPMLSPFKTTKVRHLTRHRQHVNDDNDNNAILLEDNDDNNDDALAPPPCSALTGLMTTRAAFKMNMESLSLTH